MKEYFYTRKLSLICLLSLSAITLTACSTNQVADKLKPKFSK